MSETLLNRVLHEHRYVLLDTGGPESGGFFVDSRFNLATLSAITELAAHLIGYPVQLIVEGLRSEFLNAWHLGFSLRLAHLWRVVKRTSVGQPNGQLNLLAPGRSAHVAARTSTFGPAFTGCSPSDPTFSAVSDRQRGRRSHGPPSVCFSSRAPRMRDCTY